MTNKVICGLIFLFLLFYVPYQTVLYIQPTTLSKYELPIDSSPHVFANDQRLIVVSTGISRVQIYSQKGKFLNGFFIDKTIDSLNFIQIKNRKISFCLKSSETIIYYDLRDGNSQSSKTKCIRDKYRSNFLGFNLTGRDLFKKIYYKNDEGKYVFDHKKVLTQSYLAYALGWMNTLAPFIIVILSYILFWRAILYHLRKKEALSE